MNDSLLSIKETVIPKEAIMKQYEFLDNLEQWLLNLGMNADVAQFSKIVISLVAVFLLAFIAKLIVQEILLVTVEKLAKKTENLWDDFLVERKVFQKLSRIAPALVVMFTIEIALSDYSLSISHVIEKICVLYIVFAMVLVLAALLDALHDMYLTTETAQVRPIKGYVQLVKIILFLLGTVVLVSIIIGKNPLNLLVGMGASAALLMLVFKDTILGFVASVQVSANNMVKPGDWIQMPGRNADGTVIEISLNTVKVQNWDRTISTIPTYALVSESFTNWKGMQESDGRRIKRSLYIDMRSVKFCSNELIEKLKKVHYLKEYIEQRSLEIEEYNKTMQVDTSIPVNGRRMTNLGVFRKYIEFYLQNNPNINNNATQIVRQLQPTDKGIPLEIYCFSVEKSWELYEAIQSDLFDHFLAVVPHFELRVFQDPSGEDFQKLIS
ncbi:MAG: mechanosensitive ion channel [Bacteroidales bacterium]|nr:mechanosensitive ion channel [Bacteroidales bacterium]